MKRFNIQEWQDKNLNEAFEPSDMRGWIKDTQNFSKKLEAYLKAIDEYTDSGKVKDIRAVDGLRINLDHTINVLSTLPTALKKFERAEK